MSTRCFLLAGILAASACAAGPAEDQASCSGSKCDEQDPDLDDDDFCHLRRLDVLSPNGHGFTRDALRWSCDDVSSIDGDDRGQEYCEYFAVVEPPSADEALLYGHPLGLQPSDGTTTSEVVLDAYAITELESDPSALVGQCVFSSWFTPPITESPVPEVVPSEPATIMGLPITADTFRMRYPFNTRKAGRDLFEACMTLSCEGSDDSTCQAPEVGDLDDISDPLHDDFLRACELNARANDTAFRKSDNIACAAALRMAECGCGIDRVDSVPDELVPPDLKGLPLGTWSAIDELPAGCSYVGDDTQTLVACDITAAHLLRGAADIKDFCRREYAPNVVVHVPVPADRIECVGGSESVYGKFCSAEPWVLPPLGGS